MRFRGGTLLFRVVVLGDQQRRFEDTGLNRLDFDRWREVRGEVRVDFFKSKLQLPAYGHPFCSFQVVVLEQEEQGRGA